MTKRDRLQYRYKGNARHTSRTVGRQVALAFAMLLTGILMVGSPAFATNVAGNYTTDQTWTLAGSPYNLTLSVQISGGATLTIEPGVVVNQHAHNLGAGYYASSGIILATGATFNGDGSNRLILGNFDAVGRIEDCTFNNLRIELGTSHCDVVNNTITNTTPIRGIAVTGTAAPTIEGNTISGSAVGVYCEGSASPIVRQNNFAGNTVGLENAGSALVMAEWNWWGATSGPYHTSLNPSGTGEQVIGNVDFDPWLNQDACLLFSDGFEVGPLENNWFFDVHGWRGTKQYTTTNPHSGNQCLFMKGSDHSPGASSFMETVPSMSAATAHVSFWVRDLVMLSSGASAGHLDVYLYDNSGNYLYLKEQPGLELGYFFLDLQGTRTSSGIKLTELPGWIPIDIYYESGINSRVRVMVDHTTVIDVVPPTAVSALDRVYLGVGGQYLNTAEVYLDDFAIECDGNTSVGLLAHWTFDEGSGTTVADITGHGNDGTLFGTPDWSEGVCGGGMYFDGVSDYVQCDSPVRNTPPYTVCAWVKPETLNDGDDLYFLANGGETNNSQGFALFKWYQSVNRGWSMTAQTSAALGGQAWVNDVQPKWTFICGSWDGSSDPGSIKLYVDGVERATADPGTVSAGALEWNLVIGSTRNGIEPTRMWRGHMDEVRIYDIVLSDAEILALYEECVPPDPCAGNSAPTACFTLKSPGVVYGGELDPFRLPPDFANYRYFFKEGQFIELDATCTEDQEDDAGSLTYSWPEFGTSGQIARAPHPDTGEQSVSVVVTDPCGNSGQTDHSIYVSAPVSWNALTFDWPGCEEVGLDLGDFQIDSSATIKYYFHRRLGTEDEDMAGDEEWEVIRQAMNMWESVRYSAVRADGSVVDSMPIVKFEPAETPGDAHIVFKFSRKWWHYWKWWTDFENGAAVVYRTRENQRGIAFNDLDWEFVSCTPIKLSHQARLFSVASHEIGHALGLGHKYPKKEANELDPELSVMHPTKNHCQDRLGLDDIAGLWRLYGPLTSRVGPLDTFEGLDYVPFSDANEPPDRKHHYDDNRCDSWFEPREVFFGSPVVPIIYDLNGDSIGEDFSTISGSFYLSIDSYGDSTEEKYIWIDSTLESVFRIALTPEPGTPDSALFTIIVTSSEGLDTLAWNEFVFNIPPAGYFYSTLDTGSVAGTVAAGTQGLLGVPVDLYDDLGAWLESDVTDADGGYGFYSLPNAAYTVSIATPLGYQAAEESQEIVVQGLPHTVDFELTALAITPTQRSRGYWTNRLRKALKGHPKEYSMDDFSGFASLITQHFNSNQMNAVDIYQVEQPASQRDSLNALYSLLKGGMKCGDRANKHKNKAKSQLAALLLNVAAGKLSQTEIISEDGANVSQAVTYANYLINTDSLCMDYDDDDDDDHHGDHHGDGHDGDHDDDDSHPSRKACLKLAKEIADEINEGDMLDAGMVPLDIMNIAYRIALEAGTDVPREFGLFQNYPNPFNASTAITFSLSEGGDVRLEVFDVLGRSVAILVERYLEPGLHTVGWSGRTSSGREASSGMYFYRLNAGSRAESRKMVLLK